MAPRIHVVANQKGGVGKTTITVNLAAITADVLRADPDNSPILVVSIDPQASLVWWAERVEKQERKLPFDYIQTHEHPERLQKLRAMTQYQHIFIDTPGKLENEHLLAAALDVADDVIVPMLTEPLSFDPTARSVARVIQPRGIPFKVVINAWDPRDGDSDLEQTKKFIAARGYGRANTTVRRYKLHTRASADGMVVTHYPKNRVAGEAREDFLRLALELGLGPTAPVPAPRPAAKKVPATASAAEAQ